jgi:AcrR family transcriptional regulator
VARKVGITTEQVIDAAAVIADRGGLDAVSLATVAAALDVRSPSLYSHVEGLDGLRRGLGRRASLLLAVQLEAATSQLDDPRATLRAMAHAYRAFAGEHPGLYAALLPVPRAVDDPEGAAAAATGVAVISAVLGQLGIDAGRHVDLIRTLRAVLHGFVDLELGGGFGLANPVDTSFDVAVDLVLGAIEARATTKGT